MDSPNAATDEPAQHTDGVRAAAAAATNGQPSTRSSDTEPMSSIATTSNTITLTTAPSQSSSSLQPLSSTSFSSMTNATTTNGFTSSLNNSLNLSPTKSKESSTKDLGGSYTISNNNNHSKNINASTTNSCINVMMTNAVGSDQTEGAKPKTDVKMTESDKQTYSAIFKLCKKLNLEETAETFKQEVYKQQGLSEQQLIELAKAADVEGHVASVLNTYKSEGDPSIYDDSYERLNAFIDNSLDTYRHELAMLIYPVFVHMYLELVYNGHENQAIGFMKRFSAYQEDYYMDDVRKLAVVTKKEQMSGNQVIDNFRNRQNLFTVRLSRDSYNYLKRFLNDAQNSIVHNITQEHLLLDIYEGLTRTRQQVHLASGSMLGEATKQANKTRVYYGLLKEPEINVQIQDDDGDDAGGEAGGDGDRPRKKKQRKEIISKKSRNDPNAPPLTRIPLPELRDIDKIERINALRDSAKRLKLGPNTLPSICFYTLLNANQHLQQAALCVDISEDSAFIAAGFADATIIVWPLTVSKLRGMKPASELELIDKEADDVLARMMDNENTTDQKYFRGHNGPVYAIHFSPDKTLLISCSEDGTIRLWSLLTWTNVCVYKGHCFPVWDIKFSPHGYYFASCSHDRTAKLWATDSHNPLRHFAGHISDVDVIQFHPNSNYIATGSSDRSVRLWDVSNGQCVRYYTGHKGKIYTLLFSNCGRYLISAGQDKNILFWHLGQGHLVAQLTGHQDTIYSMCFSRDGNMLATGGNDDVVNLWDANKLIEDMESEELNIAQCPAVKTYGENLLLGSYRTKSTNIFTLHFTRRNLLIASGIMH